MDDQLILIWGDVGGEFVRDGVVIGTIVMHEDVVIVAGLLVVPNLFVLLDVSDFVG